MRVAVIGTGYPGLVTDAGLADMGIEVVVVMRSGFERDHEAPFVPTRKFASYRPAPNFQTGGLCRTVAS